jgi:zinc transport system ATP-binding protein
MDVCEITVIDHIGRRQGPELRIRLMDPKAFELEHVSFSYGSEAVVTDATISVEQGDFLGIIGPNGGGKTTLLRLVLGVLKPTSGTVRLLGNTPEKTRFRAGYVPQETSSNKLFPISVLNVALMGRLAKRGIGRSYTREDREAAMSILEQMKLASLAQRTISELSGGQRQKLLLARALVSHPDIIFLDEPTASIDSTGQNEISEHLNRLNQSGTTIVLVTHNVGAVSKYIKSIACVNKSLHFHSDGTIDEDMLTEAYGCPVDLIAHGLPHRVFHQHGHE